MIRFTLNELIQKIDEMGDTHIIAFNKEELLLLQGKGIERKKTMKEYREAVQETIKILKKKYTNLSAEDAHNLASDIVDKIFSILNKEN